jgi:hypothetical protein
MVKNSKINNQRNCKLLLDKFNSIFEENGGNFEFKQLLA